MSDDRVVLDEQPEQLRVPLGGGLVVDLLIPRATVGWVRDLFLACESVDEIRALRPLAAAVGIAYRIIERRPAVLVDAGTQKTAKGSTVRTFHVRAPDRSDVPTGRRFGGNAIVARPTGRAPRLVSARRRSSAVGRVRAASRSPDDPDPEPEPDLDARRAGGAR